MLKIEVILGENDVMAISEGLKKIDITIRLRRENIFSFLKKSFEKHYENNNHNISQKYGWTMQYYKNLGVWEDG